MVKASCKGTLVQEERLLSTEDGQGGNPWEGSGLLQHCSCPTDVKLVSKVCSKAAAIENFIDVAQAWL